MDNLKKKKRNFAADAASESGQTTILGNPEVGQTSVLGSPEVGQTTILGSSEVGQTSVLGSPEAGQTAELISSEANGMGDPSQNIIKMRTPEEEVKKEKKYTKKELKAIEKQRKELHKQYHISNWEILRNYKTYGEAEKRHYRYIFGRRVGDRVWPIFRFFIVFGLSFVILYPILFMISSAFKPQIETNDPSVMWIPKTFIVSNVTDVWNAIKFPSLFVNTVLINVVSSLLQVVTCAVTGYGFARFKFKFKGLLFGIVILQIIVPTQIILIPQYMQFRYFDIFGIINAITHNGGISLVDSPAALYLQAIFVNGIRSGLFVLLFRQFFRGLPKELEDAAHLDGCGPFVTFVRIMVPIAKTSFVTVFLFSLVWYWNDTYVSGIFYRGTQSTIALQIKNLWRTMAEYLNGSQDSGFAAQFMVWVQAGCLLSLFPILIIYGFMQKQFVEGIERSGITGM